MLKSERIELRGVEPGDVDYLFESENDVSYWRVSETLIPFTRETMIKYANSIHDLITQGQYRFIIQDASTRRPIGMIDLFDYNAIHRRAGVGIVITNESQRNQGVATEAIEMLKDYVQTVLNLKQIYCSIHQSNEASINLFEKLKFEKVGERKFWYKTKLGWETELLYQFVFF